jgi:hypothetical protein
LISAVLVSSAHSASEDAYGRELTSVNEKAKNQGFILEPLQKTKGAMEAVVPIEAGWRRETRDSSTMSEFDI